MTGARLKGEKKQLAISAEMHKFIKGLSFQTDIPMEVLATELLERVLKDDWLTAEVLMRIRQKHGLDENPKKRRDEE